MENINEGLIREIAEKEIELNELEIKYEENLKLEKKRVLASKSDGLNKTLYLLGFEFESSCSRTPQYLEFHRVFKREFVNLLKPYIKDISVSKPNHFDVSGFFELNDGRIYYFNISDLRWSKDNLLIRTAKDFKDYTGGSNDYISLDETFADSILKYLNLK